LNAPETRHALALEVVDSVDTSGAVDAQTQLTFVDVHLAVLTCIIIEKYSREEYTSRLRSRKKKNIHEHGQENHMYRNSTKRELDQKKKRGTRDVLYY